MKKFVFACACLSLFSAVLIPRANVYSQQSIESRQIYAGDRIVVKLKTEAEPGSDADVIAEEIVRAPGATAEALTNQQRGRIDLIHLNRNVSVEEAVRRANEDPRVEYAEPDYFVYAADTIPNDPRFSELWGLSNVGCSFCAAGQQSANIDAIKAWDITTGSDNIVAVVLDTGADLLHEDLAANAWVNPGEVAGNGVDDDGNGFIDDVNGWSFYDGNNQTFKNASEDLHGTHVAGSIGAVGNNAMGVTGVAWRVKLMSLKFLGGPLGKGSTSNAIRGINYAIAMRQRGVNVRVINASWGGGGDSQALRDAIAAANDAGILFVCAAGNDGQNQDDTPSYPAAYGGSLPSAISIAAVDQSGFLPSFSNFGHGSISLAAPGVNILSTSPNGGYRTLNGTSMSTPYVSGIAVLLWSQDPSLSPAQVKQRIVDTSEPLPALASKVARSGRASAYYALTNRIAPPQQPVVTNVQFTKRTVIVDGLGFADGSAVIEVDGIPLDSFVYDGSYALANGTLTRVIADIGKKPLKRAFPAGVLVSVDMFNPTTGERSARFITGRF